MKRTLAFGVVLLWLPLSACGFIYSAEAIEGWVVDAGTGKPIDGVVVVAHWQLKGGFEGGTPIAELQILEAVTDSSGRYYFPAWGPKFSLTGNLRSESPEILMFAPGYKFLGLSNQWYEGRDSSKFDYNKKTVRLERFKGTLAEYAESLSSLNSSLERVGYGVGYHSGDYCGWRSFPKMLRVLAKLEGDFRAAGVRQGTVASFLKRNEAQVRDKGCGSVSDLLERAER
jgi:hypothetical protein